MYTTELVRFEPAQRCKQEQDEGHDSDQQEPQTYREAVRKYYLRFHDLNLVSVFMCNFSFYLIIKFRLLFILKVQQANENQTKPFCLKKCCGHALSRQKHRTGSLGLARKTGAFLNDSSHSSFPDDAPRVPFCALLLSFSIMHPCTYPFHTSIHTHTHCTLVCLTWSLGADI